jgi:hypothetical protein
MCQNVRYRLNSRGGSGVGASTPKVRGVVLEVEEALMFLPMRSSYHRPYRLARQVKVFCRSTFHPRSPPLPTRRTTEPSPMTCVGAVSNRDSLRPKTSLDLQRLQYHRSGTKERVRVDAPPIPPIAVENRSHAGPPCVSAPPGLCNYDQQKIRAIRLYPKGRNPCTSFLN